MFVLFFYMVVNGVNVPLTQGQLDHYDSRMECVDAGKRMLTEVTSPKVGYKCVELVFTEKQN